MNISRKVITFIKTLFVALASLLAFSAAFAQDPAAFVIDIQPASFDTNTSVDMTIKAIDSNWDVLKDYQWDVFIDVAWSLDTSDYTVPSEGLYTFVPQDQWVKLFSKWVMIKKAGTFTITVSDITNDNIKWEKTVIVWWNHSSSNTKKINIVSPNNGWLEKSEAVNVIWSSIDLPNSPFEVYLNDALVIQDTTDSNWSINVYITGMKQWENSLKVKILDLSSTVVGESDLLKFSYDPLTDWTFKRIETTPNNKVTQWTKLNFKVFASDDVTSVTLIFSNWRSTPLDLQTAWVFSKDFTIDTKWEVSVNLELMAAWTKKAYTWVTNLTIVEWISVGKVRVFTDTSNKNRINLTWEMLYGDAKKYKIIYWTEQNTLNLSDIVDTKEVSIEWLQENTTYYFRIIPLDQNETEIWTASDIVQATPGQETAETTCTVQWIKIADMQIWDKYYLSRSWVSNVEKYIIYRADFETADINQMQKVWETTDTKFEYPFNRTSKTEKYAYYMVQASCKDGKAVLMDSVKKIKTWPAETMALIVFIALFVYSMYRLNLTTKNTY